MWFLEVPEGGGGGGSPGAGAEPARPAVPLPPPPGPGDKLAASPEAAEPRHSPQRGGGEHMSHSRTLAPARAAGLGMVRMGSAKFPLRRLSSREGSEGGGGDSLVDMSDWSVYRMYVFSDLAFSHKNYARDFVLLFYCLSSVLIQTLIPLALFVNNYSTHTLDGVDVEDLALVGPDGALPEYRYKSFSCKFRGTKDLTNYQISSKILVFLVCLMYFLKMTPLAVRHIIRFIGYNTIKSFHEEDGGAAPAAAGGAPPPSADAPADLAAAAGKGEAGGEAGAGQGDNPQAGGESELPQPAGDQQKRRRNERALSKGVNDFVTFITGDSERVRALSDYAALEAIAWEMGGLRLAMYYIDLYAQTIYVAMAYLFNLFIIYNTEDTFDVIFNALAIEFIVIFDEEAVGPLLNLLEYLFKRSPEQIAEKVTDKIVETERKFSQGTVHTMDDYLGSRFKWRVSKSAVAGFRLVFVKFAIIFALVLFEVAIASLLLLLPVCY